MKPFIALLLSVFLLTACTPQGLYNAYQQRKMAETLSERADAMALVAVGDSMPSYIASGRIHTDVRVSVLRGQGVQPGTAIILRRNGGTVTNPDGTVTQEIVDYAYRFPAKGEEVYLLLRRVGEKYEVIDGMALRAGQPTKHRSAHDVYVPALKSLP